MQTKQQETTSLNKILLTIRKFDIKKEQNQDWELIQTNVAASIYRNKPLTFVQFTCSTINPKYLFNQKEPEKYVSLDPQGNNLEPDLPLLEKFYLKLAAIMPVRLIILIGDTDPYYIYSQEWSCYPKLNETLLWRRFGERWAKYKKNLRRWLNFNLPRINAEIVSWYELEKKWEAETKTDFQKLFRQTYKNIGIYFRKEELEWEFKNLSNAFGPEKYFYNLKKPSDSILKDWVRRKFTEYAVQGLWIKQIWPGAILIQNEKPTDLRYKMYQPLIEKIYKSKLPNVFLYGVDTLGFQ